MQPLEDARSRTDERLVFRTCTPADLQPLLSLFRRVFGTRRNDRGAAEWCWRFGLSPRGGQSCLAEERETGRIVAHVGGTPHDTWWNGEVRQTIECVDHMVDLDYRSGLRHKPLFARLKLHWFDSFCGADKNFLAWGFPSRSDYRIGQRQAGYALARNIHVLYQRDIHRLPGGSGAVRVREVPRFGEDVDELWKRCREELRCCLVRDRTHLNWRYASCPANSYRLHEARSSHDGTLQGVAVLRAGGIADDVAMLMDWLVPLDDEPAHRALLGSAARWVKQLGLCGLVTWFPECTPHFARFQEIGFDVHPTPAVLTARSWDPRVTLADVRASFYMTFGEMDSY